MRKLRPLLTHQRPALAYAREAKHPALWMQMRLGKTAVCIRAVEAYGPRPLALVIAPNSALGDWRRELLREGVAEHEVVRLSGTRAKRLGLLDKRAEGARWFLLNKEGWQVVPEVAGAARCDECKGRGYVIIVNDKKVLCTACLGRGYTSVSTPAPWWDAVILDESTFVKNPNARVTKFMLTHFRDAQHRWALTGLPNPEGPLNLWCQLAWLDGEALGCRSFWEFRARYFTEAASGFGFELRSGVAETINRLVSARAFVMTRQDAGVEFVQARERREVELPARMLKTYRAAERDYVLELDGREVDRTKYSTTRWQWMRQACGGFVDGELVWPGKIDELLRLLQGELAGEQVVVWFAYNQELHAADNILARAGIPCNSIWGDVPVRTREDCLESWRRGDVRVLLAQMAALDRGVDLSAADTMFFYSTHASGEMRQQCEERTSHPSKTTPQLIVDLVVPGTVDEDVVESLALKKWMSDGALRRAVELRMRGRRQV